MAETESLGANQPGRSGDDLNPHALKDSRLRHWNGPLAQPISVGKPGLNGRIAGIEFPVKCPKCGTLSWWDERTQVIDHGAGRGGVETHWWVCPGCGTRELILCVDSRSRGFTARIRRLKDRYKRLSQEEKQEHFNTFETKFRTLVAKRRLTMERATEKARRSLT